MKLPIVVSPEQVNEAANEGIMDGQVDGPIKRLKIVDLRSLEDFEASHLPGAIHLDVSLLNRVESPVGGLLPDFSSINATISALGLQSDDHIVAYDKGVGTAAARLIWVLDAYGFHATSWLNGGFNAWTAAGFSTSTEVALPAPGDATLQFTPGNILSADQLIEELCNDNIRVLDVRSAAEFNGTDVRSARGGHVPNAQHSEWTSVFNDAGQLKSDEDLYAMFESLGINQDHHVVVYCQTHQRSALSYVVLKHLQFQQVSAIDGAWSAWGNRTDTPIEP